MMKRAIGKVVARVETEKAQLTTYDRRMVNAISRLVFTDGSSVSFWAVEVEHADPVPMANYHGRPRRGDR